MSDVERYDLLIVGERTGMRISPHGIRALITWMGANGHLVEVMEAHGEGWTEVFGQPGGFAHAIFHDGPATKVKPAFLEFGARWGDDDLDTGYALPDPVRFFFEFRGCAFDRVQDELLERIDGIFYCRPVVWRRSFEALRERIEVDAPEDPRRKKPDRADGRTGVRVEEF